jgi:hypothetical protein
MNYNIIAYLVYLALTLFIIVYVGRLFYRNGRIFILSLFKQDAALADQINHILLIAYYLFNIGYAFVRLHFWQRISGTEALISSIASHISLLIFILAATHYVNMALIYYFSRSKTSSITSKSFQS